MAMVSEAATRSRSGKNKNIFSSNETTLLNLPSSGEGVGAVARVDLAGKWRTEVKRRPIDTRDVGVMCDGL